MTYKKIFSHFRKRRNTSEKLLLGVIKDDTMINIYHGENVPVNDDEGLFIAI